MKFSPLNDSAYGLCVITLADAQGRGRATLSHNDRLMAIVLGISFAETLTLATIKPALFPVPEIPETGRPFQSGVVRLELRILELMWPKFGGEGFRFIADCASVSGLVRILTPASGAVVASVQAGIECHAMAGIDFDGDGNQEVALGNQAGRIKAFRISNNLLTLMFTYIAQSPVADSFGVRLVRLGDLDGDGKDNWAVSAPRADLNGTDSGAVQLFNGDPTAALPYLTLLGSSAGALYGKAIAKVPDDNADGKDDLIVGIQGQSRLSIADGLSGIEIRHFIRNGDDGLGIRVRGGDDINGDNVNDFIAGFNSGTTILSGRDGSVLREYAATGEALFVGKAAHIDVDQMFSAILVGGTQVIEGNSYACPPFTGFVWTDNYNGGHGVAGNYGVTPQINSTKGCFLEHGQLRVEVSALDPLPIPGTQILPPVFLVASNSPTLNTSSPFIVEGYGLGANYLWGSRTDIAWVHVGVAAPAIPGQPTPGTGRLAHILRDVQTTDPNNDGIGELYIQAFQAPQLVGAHPQGGQMSSTAGLYVPIQRN